MNLQSANFTLAEAEKRLRAMNTTLVLGGMDRGTLLEAIQTVWASGAEGRVQKMRSTILPARWVRTKDKAGKDVTLCDLCMTEASVSPKDSTKYHLSKWCPNCGAQMTNSK